MDLTKLRIKQDRLNVNLYLNGQPLMELYWKDADELGNALREIYYGRESVVHASPNILVQLYDGGLDVLYRGNLALKIPTAAVLEVFRVVKQVTRFAEALHEVHKTIYDQALLLKGGAPYGLTDNPKVIDEAVKEALWETDVKKYFSTPGIPSKAVFGVPKLIGGEVNKWIMAN